MIRIAIWVLFLVNSFFVLLRGIRNVNIFSFLLTFSFSLVTSLSSSDCSSASFSCSGVTVCASGWGGDQTVMIKYWVCCCCDSVCWPARMEVKWGTSCLCVCVCFHTCSAERRPSEPKCASTSRVLTSILSFYWPEVFGPKQERKPRETFLCSGSVEHLRTDHLTGNNGVVAVGS